MSVTTLNTFQSLQNTVIVRSAADFPDAILRTHSNTVNNGGFTEFQFAAPHGYSLGQTIEILTDPSQTSNIGFHLVTEVINTVRLLTDLVFTGFSTGGTSIRALAKDTNYVLATPIVTNQGYRYEDGANLAITSTDRYVNTISMSAGAARTFLSGRNIGTVELDVVVTDTTGTIFPPAPGTHKLFDIVGGGNTFSEILFTRNCRFEDFEDLGNISGISIGFLNTLFVEYTTGLIVNFAFLNVSRIVVFSDIADSVFLTLDNAGLSPFGAITAVFTGNTFNLQDTTANLFDIKPDMNPVNTVVVTNSSGVGIGKFFKPGSELTATITSFTSPDTNTISLAAAAAPGFTSLSTPSSFPLVVGDKVFISGDPFDTYGGIHTVTTINAFDFEIEVPFSHTITGKWERVGSAPTTVNATAHGLTTGSVADMINTFSYTGKKDITLIDANSFTIPDSFIDNDVITTPGFETNFDQIREISVIARNATINGSIDGISTGTGGRAQIDTPDIGTQLKDGDTVTIAGTPSNDGTFPISSVVDNVSFDIEDSFIAAAGVGGTWTLERTDITVENHLLSVSDSILVDKTVSYDGRNTVLEVNGQILTIDSPFVANDARGTVSDGSLTQTALNVLTSIINGEIDSKAKGSFSMNGNVTPTPAEAAVFTDFILQSAIGVPDVIETNDTESWRLIDKVKGVLEYRGIEPFSGQMAVAMFVAKDGGGSSTYTIRALRNNGPMVDNIEESFTTSSTNINVSFLVPVTAVTGDTFKMQFSQVIGDDLLVGSITTVIQ